MDAEDQLWIAFSIIIITLFVIMIAYSVFISAPHHTEKISQCEQMGGIAVTDDGRYRLCLKADAVIELEETNYED